MGEFPNKETQFSSENQPEGRGRPKGSKNLSTIVRELESEDFDWSLVPITGKREVVEKIGAPWRAIVYRALVSAWDGDVRAMEWLRKSGYGDKLDVTTKGRPISEPVVITKIEPRNVETETQAEASSETTK